MREREREGQLAPGVTVSLQSLLATDMEESENIQPAPPPSQDIVKEGWLMKRGEVIKNWRPR